MKPTLTVQDRADLYQFMLKGMRFKFNPSGQCSFLCPKVNDFFKANWHRFFGDISYFDAHSRDDIPEMHDLPEVKYLKTRSAFINPSKLSREGTESDRKKLNYHHVWFKNDGDRMEFINQCILLNKNPRTKWNQLLEGENTTNS